MRSRSTNSIGAIAMRSIQVVCSFVLTAAVGVSGQGQEAWKPAGDIAQGAGPVVTLEGHKARVTSLVFSPDGRRVVSASSKDVRTWDLATGKEVESRAYAGGQVVALFPDGGRMV